MPHFGGLWTLNSNISLRYWTLELIVLPSQGPTNLHLLPFVREEVIVVAGEKHCMNEEANIVNIYCLLPGMRLLENSIAWMGRPYLLIRYSTLGFEFFQTSSYRSAFVRNWNSISLQNVNMSQCPRLTKWTFFLGCPVCILFEILKMYIYQLF